MKLRAFNYKITVKCRFTVKCSLFSQLVLLVSLLSVNLPVILRQLTSVQQQHKNSITYVPIWEFYLNYM